MYEHARFMVLGCYTNCTFHEPCEGDSEHILLNVVEMSCIFSLKHPSVLNCNKTITGNLFHPVSNLKFLVCTKLECYCLSSCTRILPQNRHLSRSLHVPKDIYINRMSKLDLNNKRGEKRNCN